MFLRILINNVPCLKRGWCASENEYTVHHKSGFPTER
jgi:hypothetical protein